LISRLHCTAGPATAAARRRSDTDNGVPLSMHRINRELIGIDPSNADVILREEPEDEEEDEEKSNDEEDDGDGEEGYSE